MTDEIVKSDVEQESNDGAGRHATPDPGSVTIPADAYPVAEVYRFPHGRYLLRCPVGPDGRMVGEELPDREDVLGALEFLFKKADGVDWSHPLHPQVPAYCPIIEETIQVDVKMKPLLRALWECGIMTSLSCQGDAPRGHAWITFSHREHVDWFGDLCRKIVRVGDVNIHYYDRGLASVCFPNGKIRALTRAVRRGLSGCLRGGPQDGTA